MPVKSEPQQFDPAKSEDLLEQFPELYATLRRIARRHLRRNPAGTLSTTMVVNEAWLKLQNKSTQWHDHQHFLATAALAMRQLLVDYARRKAAEKRTRVDDCPLFKNDCDLSGNDEAVLAVDEALEQLSSIDPRLTRLVELRFFVGLTLAEAADCLRISSRTANRDWARARAFIRTAIERC